MGNKSQETAPGPEDNQPEAARETVEAHEAMLRHLRANRPAEEPDEDTESDSTAA